MKNPIKDIYIKLDNPEEFIVFPRGSTDHADHEPIIAAILKARKMTGSHEFSVKIEDSGVYRCTEMPSINGVVIAARWHDSEIPDLYKLGLPFGITKWLSSSDLCSGGLVLIVGSPGSGKSTTCAAMIANRLNLHGGVTITIEDPPEFQLQGQFNTGVCWQIPVSSNGEYQVAMKTALRGYPAGVPSSLVLGEVRDSDAVVSVLNAAIDGRLVMITMHAGDAVSALGRLRVMATEAMGMNQADYLIAESLQGVLYQKLKDGKVEADLLIANESVKATIRGGKYEYMATEIDRQRIVSSRISLI